MRLSLQQVEAIRYAAATIFGPEVIIWLFGSRADDQKRGGDIDLLIKPANPEKYSLADKLAFLKKLERDLGMRKIDVVIEGANDCRSIVQVAHQTGVLL